MAIKDIETLLTDIKDHLKDNLNTEIAAINTDKGDFTIDTITADNDHYVIIQDLYDLPNRAFVAIGIIDNIEGELLYNDYKLNVPIEIKVVFANANKPNTYFKALRYMKALTNVMLDYESSAIEVEGMQLINSMPMIVQAEHRELITTGLSVNISIS